MNEPTTYTCISGDAIDQRIRRAPQGRSITQPIAPSKECAAPLPIGQLQRQQTAAALAHEFNNLLAVVLGSLEQLGALQLDARAQAQLKRATWAAEQAARLSKDVLSGARQAAAGASTVVDLNAVLQDLQ